MNIITPRFFVVAALVFAAASTPSIQAQSPSASPGAVKPANAAPAPAKNTPPAPIEGYQVQSSPANIAPTVATRKEMVEVAGQPRNNTKHPNVFWDQTDIDHYKEMLKTSKELQLQLAEKKAQMDTRIALPIAIPPPKKGPDGKWLYPGDYFPPIPGRPENVNDPLLTVHRFGANYTQDGDDISDLGIVYTLTGEQKYADYAKQLLLAYAHCNEWGAGPYMSKVGLRSASGIAGQLLDETLIMDHFVNGYDLIYNLPSWTAAERKQLHDDFFFPMACCYLYPAAVDADKEGGGSYCSQLNNRGVIGVVAVLAMGYASDDQQLIDAAIYGIHSKVAKCDQIQIHSFPPRQDWEAATPRNPGHGLLNSFFAEACIPGGMWVEGSPSYSFYALGSMVDAAEICWHHGIDLYRNNNAIFKNMFDFPILLSYPDLSTPGLNDGHRDPLYGGYAPCCYEYGYRRYQDPRYLAMINTPKEREYLAALADPASASRLAPPAPYGPTAPRPTPLPAGATPTPTPAPTPPLLKSERRITLTRVGAAPPCFMYDLDPKAGTSVPSSPSVNYAQVGFGILRTPTHDGKSVQSLTFSYGPLASHGHPDKLHIDLYALGDVLMPSPGVNFPYNNNFRIEKWYHTTLAHNTLTVDEKSMEYYTAPIPARADQTVFAPASTAGMERAWSTTAYHGVTMDRAVFITSDYLADIYGAFSASLHKYDLAWHIRGDVSSPLTFSPIKFDQKINGYNWFTTARSADAGEKPWTVTLNRDGNIARLHVASGPATQAIVGDGGIYVDSTSSDPTGKPTCPTIIERRDNTASTIYGNALDFSGNKDGYVKNITQEGSLADGYALLKVTTPNGTDLCFSSYRPGNYNKAGVLETDAQQALVLTDGTKVRTMYLAGGKVLKVAGASITRSEPGLAYVEKLPNGTYVVGNPSPGDATITVMLMGVTTGKPFTTTLKANTKVELITQSH